MAATTDPIQVPAAAKVARDEGLLFCVLRCFCVDEVGPLWSVERLFHRVLDRKVAPLTALAQRNWCVVRHYMGLSPSGHARFKYNLGTICAESVLHRDLDGLRLLARQRYDFGAMRCDARLSAFAGEALRGGHPTSMFDLQMLRAIGFDFGAELAQGLARGDVAESLSVHMSILVDFFGTHLSYSCSALDFATTDFVERQLKVLCSNRATLFEAVFVVAAFLRAGASSCSFLRPEGCGYLLLLAVASESFNFVYLLVKEAIHLEAIFELYRSQLVLLVLRALEHRRFAALDLLLFSGYRLAATEQEEEQLDAHLLRCLLQEDLYPLERMCCLGYSLRRLAERHKEAFEAFVQRCLVSAVQGRPPCCNAQQQPVSPDEVAPTCPAYDAVRKLAALDPDALELHFQSQSFFCFVHGLLAGRSFEALRQVAALHPKTLSAYFVAHCEELEALLLDAYVRRDVDLIVDVASVSFPIGLFLAKHRTQVDDMLLGSWLPHKCWMELSTLQRKVPAQSFPALFERNRSRADAFVLGVLENGYWFDLHNLAQLAFNFPAFFDRCFEAVSVAVLNFITMQHPHFVLLRELSALAFPWARFMQAHRGKIPWSKDRDFLDFVICSQGFELGSKVYEVVEQTCQLYHSMEAPVFKLAPASERGAAARRPGTVPVPSEAQKPAEASSPSSSSSSSPDSSAQPPKAEPEVLLPHLEESRAGHEFQGSDAAAGAGPGLTQQPPPSEDLLAAQRAQVQDLVRRAKEGQLDVAKVVRLLIWRGVYCWSPLSVEAEGMPEAGTWSEVQHVLRFLQPQSDAMGSEVPPAAAGPPAQVPVPGVAGGAMLPAGFFNFVPSAQASAVNAQALGRGQSQAPGHRHLHVVCHAPRHEEQNFQEKVHPFWSGILDSVLPHPATTELA